MKCIRNIMIGLGLLLIPIMSHAAEAVISYPVATNSINYSESRVLVSSAVGGTVLSSSDSTRVAFDVQFATCGASGLSTTKMYYSYDSALVSTNSAYVNLSATSADNWFRIPSGLAYQGSIYARVEPGAITNCTAIIREWSLNSQIFK